MRRTWSWVGAVGLLIGCNRPAPAPDGTGAEEAVRIFYAAIVGRDWQRAYETLHPDSRLKCDAEQFARRARSYRQNLGFEPEEVRVRSCEEHGGEAVAHVVLAGQSGDRRRSFKDGVSLRRSASGWGVVLPPRFGRLR